MSLDDFANLAKVKMLMFLAMKIKVPKQLTNIDSHMVPIESFLVNFVLSIKLES